MTLFIILTPFLCMHGLTRSAAASAFFCVVSIFVVKFVASNAMSGRSFSMSSFFSHALSTASSSRFKKICIIFIKWVSSFTMCLSALNTTEVFDPKDIFTMRYGFEMVRINAISFFTKMINFQSIWDWAFVNFIRISMGFQNTLKGAEIPIPVDTFGFHPEPAGCSFFYGPPKSGLRGIFKICHNLGRIMTPVMILEGKTNV